MSKTIAELRTTGFQKLRAGRIHTRCYSCGMKRSNAERMGYDPQDAVLVENECERCGSRSGSKEPEFFYFRADGTEITDDISEDWTL